MTMTIFALSAGSTLLYLWSLYLMRSPTRFGWGITLASLALTVVQVYMVGAYPSLLGCVIGAAICVRNFRTLTDPPPELRSAQAVKEFAHEPVGVDVAPLALSR